jgi:hypothetical protein
MSSTVFDALVAVFPAVVAEMPPEFDSHDFILKLAQVHQRLYTQALVEYATTDRPFQIAHGQIANSLLGFPHLVTKIGERNSPDIFRQMNSASIWRKTSK